MVNKADTALIILAGGKSSRAETIKAFRIFKNDIWLNYVIRHYLDFDINQVFIGLGYHGDLIRSKLLTDQRVHIVMNKQPENGQFSTLVTVLSEIINENWKSVFISPVDVPPLSYESLDQILSGAAQIVKASYLKKSGHPVLLNKDMCKELSTLDKHSGRLDQFMQQYVSETEYVSINDPLLHMNLNTESNWKAFLKRID